MFARVSRRYDLLNHLLSFRRDVFWRAMAAKEAAGLSKGDTIADLCTGTGDLALALHQAAPAARLLAFDFTPEMLALGQAKASARGAEQIHFYLADALALPLQSNSAALACVAFGIRNVADWRGALREMARVVRPGGKIVILEFTQPRGIFFGRLYQFYFHRILPLLARLFSSRSEDAYRYLPRSVRAFAGPEELCACMREFGLADVQAKPLTFGIVHLCRGTKKICQ